MQMDPLMPQMVSAILLILATGIILKVLKQPHVIAYLAAGVVIGPMGLGLIDDAATIGRLGAFGVVLLLFFVGMETEPRKFIKNWKIALLGTLFQIFLSIFCAWLLGHWFNWPLSRSILIGFVISISSTVIVIKFLQDGGILNSRVGQGALGITITHDLAVIPMLVILGLLTSGEINIENLIKQGVGTIIVISLLTYLFKKKQLSIPMSRWLKDDRELQLFTALGLCFGCAFLIAWFELSTALGAFLAGMIVGAARETQWVHHTLDSFRVLFIALFFVSVGMLLDIKFLLFHWRETLSLLAAATLINTAINTLVLKLVEFNWRESLYAGSLLSQIGEFSFVLAAVGFQASIIDEYGYQLALSVISLSLLTSPFWIKLCRKISGWKPAVPSQTQTG